MADLMVSGRTVLGLLACGALVAAYACGGEGSDLEPEDTGGSGGVIVPGGSGGGGPGAGSGGGGPVGGTGGGGPVGGSGGGGGTATGGTGGGGTGTGGGPITNSCSGSEQVAPGTNPMIDDLEDGDDAIPEVGNRLGFWFTYNDETPGAVQEPTGSEYTPFSGGANGTAFSAYTTGQDFSDWGAGMGVNLNAVGASGCAYDASVYAGISFWARGVGSVTVMVSTVPTSPPDQGGLCDESAGSCYDHFARSISLTSEWVYHEIAWDQLAQGAWGIPATFSPAEIIAIEFQAAPIAPFEIYIDELSFLGTGTPGTGGTTGTGGSAGAPSGGSAGTPSGGSAGAPGPGGAAGAG